MYWVQLVGSSVFESELQIGNIIIKASCKPQWICVMTVML